MGNGRVCGFCGGSLTGGQLRWCDQSCKDKSRVGKRGKRNRTDRDREYDRLRGQVDKQCATCGDTFVGWRNGKRYCSPECKHFGHHGSWPSCVVKWKPEPEWPRHNLTWRPCKTCGRPFAHPRALNCWEHQTYHDPSKRIRRRLPNCPRCGVPTDSHGSKCDRCKRAKRKQERTMERVRRSKRITAVPSERYTLEDIAERDHWNCGICGKKVSRTAQVPNHQAPTVDHIIPLSQDGTNLRNNVQLAHFICNARKGDRAANDQLLLVG